MNLKKKNFLGVGGTGARVSEVFFFTKKKFNF